MKFKTLDGNSRAVAWVTLAFLSLCLRLIRWSYPAEVTFDEALIGHFLSHYFTGEYYFDIHPPHLKLWYGLLLNWGGFDPDVVGFPKVDALYPGSYYLWARAFASLCGAAVPLLATWIAIELGAQRAWAFAIGAALAMDGAMIVESKFMLNEMPMLCFGLSGWAACLKWKSDPKFYWLALGCLGLAAAGSVKLTGLSFSIPVGIAFSIGIFSKRRVAYAYALCTLINVVFVWQIAGYAIHFNLLDKTGTGNAYMSSSFNARLTNSLERKKGVEPKAWLAAVAELQYKMVFYSDKVGPHPYSSSWLSWPIGTRGIFFWTNRAFGEEVERIYMLPNLVLWWSVALAMARMALMQIPRAIGQAFRLSDQKPDYAKLWVACTFLAMWLPFAFINRPMFLYHYFPTLALGSVGLALECSGMGKPYRSALVWTLVCMALFIWTAPLTYGFGLDSIGLAKVMLLKSWP